MTVSLSLAMRNFELTIGLTMGEFQINNGSLGLYLMETYNHWKKNVMNVFRLSDRKITSSDIKSNV